MTPPLHHSWVKSSYSSQDGGNCLEWSAMRTSTHHLVPVRDSKNPNGPILAFDTEAWSSFVDGIKGDGFPTA
ncbi:DUF397 domain-containing protein [Streptomyces sp. NPDC059913]|uniref:DUF397 domain-containing protein n=1 Tax=unclassified Streptomyces TaxID=2593676 RepID=UPI0036529F7D